MRYSVRLPNVSLKNNLYRNIHRGGAKVAEKQFGKNSVYSASPWWSLIPIFHRGDSRFSNESQPV